MPLVRLDRQIQLQFLINPICALLIPAIALHIAQIQITKTKAPIPAVLRQTNQPVCNQVILSFALALIPVADLTHPEGLTSQLHRYPALSYRLLGPLAALGWPQGFFANAS